MTRLGIGISIVLLCLVMSAQTRLNQNQLGPTPAMVILEMSNCDAVDPVGTWDCRGLYYMRVMTHSGEKRYILTEAPSWFTTVGKGDWKPQPVTVLGGTRVACNQVQP